ncbi:MAG: cell division protein FtsJ [Candidatus Pristimantibacillus lignocellulolyticus]|uniref:Cell division protein FtsJ n=1 Tax=Candidatus Pristimantibacillus lignocellulolyticus TaxID=2994561 RepID=A0A9J6ZDE2_9BACL|nr:MAG: cell division protein FtsJ [Candidatus Pristimantibacillus lignocellulolyticus]
MIHVYLDDFRICPKGFVLAKDAAECKMLIDMEDIDILSLDYDLGWNQPTGFEVVQHIITTRKFPKTIYLHTSSMFGREQMYYALKESIPADVELFGKPMPQQVIDDITKNLIE